MPLKNILTIKRMMGLNNLAKKEEQEEIRVSIVGNLKGGLNQNKEVEKEEVDRMEKCLVKKVLTQRMTLRSCKKMTKTMRPRKLMINYYKMKTMK